MTTDEEKPVEVAALPEQQIMTARPEINQEFVEKRPLSPSSLKAFRKSPKHYLQYVFEPRYASDAMKLGSLVDILALTPELFDKKYMVGTKPDLRSNKGKEDWAKMLVQANALKKTIVDQSDYDKAKKMVESLMSVDMSRQLLEGKQHVQRKLEWRNKKNNLPLLGYIDFDAKVWGEKFIVDLKTAASAEPDKFARDAAGFDYELQVGGYLDAYHKKYFQFPNFIFLVVESVEPFNVSVNFCDSKYIERAKDEWQGTLTAFRYCMDNHKFNTGYEFRLMNTNNYFSIEIPKYKKKLFTGYEEKDEE